MTTECMIFIVINYFSKNDISKFFNQHWYRFDMRIHCARLTILVFERKFSVYPGVHKILTLLWLNTNKKHTLTTFYQYVSCNTRDNKTDFLCVNVKEQYR